MEHDDVRVDHRRLSRASWRCLHLVESLSPEDVTELKRLGLEVYRVVMPEEGDEKSLLACLAKEMGFPAWFGRNWDALNDCLRDMSWSTAQGYVLEVVLPRHSLVNCWGALGGLVRSWLLAAEHWSKKQRACHLVLTFGGAGGNMQSSRNPID